MAPQASSLRAMPQARQPEQFPISFRLAVADSAAAGPGEGGLRPLEVAECTMCGIERPLGLLVPDGDRTAEDVRWYCKDVRSCTDRWTTALPRRSAGRPDTFGHVVTAAGEPAPAEASAEQMDGRPEEAQAVP